MAVCRITLCSLILALRNAIHFSPKAAAAVKIRRHQAYQRHVESPTVPQYALLGPDETIETFWQRPAGEVKGLVFYAHGCNHQASDLFTNVGSDGYKFAGCGRSGCLGLPATVQLRQTARSRGYLVLAVSGTGPNNCWRSRDIQRVKLALKAVRKREGLPQVPLFLTGASSGGAMLGSLTAHQLTNLQCVVPQISSIKVPDNYPQNAAVLFMHMSRDPHTARRVEAAMQELRNAGVRAKSIEVKPEPVTLEFLHYNGSGLTSRQAGMVVTRLKSGGVIDDDGLILEDPRGSRWREALSDVEEQIGGLGLDKSKLSELMNIAYGRHEAIGHYTHRMLDFCEEKPDESSDSA